MGPANALQISLSQPRLHATPQIIISVLRTFWNISKHNTHPSNWHTVYFFTKAHTDVKMFVLWTNFSRLNLSTNSVRKFVGNFLPNLKVSLTNLLIYQTGYIVSETIPAKTNLWKISYIFWGVFMNCLHPSMCSTHQIMLEGKGEKRPKVGSCLQSLLL